MCILYMTFHIADCVAQTRPGCRSLFSQGHGFEKKTISVSMIMEVDFLTSMSSLLLCDLSYVWLYT